MILSLVEKHVTLTKKGSHYVGACPLCGGGKHADAFTVDVNRDFVQCYACGINLNPVRFLRQIEGKTCPEAHRTLGIVCDRPECPVWEKCSRGRGEYSCSHDTRPHTPRTAAPVAALATSPDELWQEKAAALVETAHQTLLDTPAMLEYLSGRGLPIGAVLKNKLGYLPADKYRPRVSWGLPEELKPDGKAKKLWIPQGIVIPSFEPNGDGQIHRIRIRKDTVINTLDNRYYWVPGSGNDIICLNSSASVHVVVEADLDGMAIDWTVGDVVATVLLGSCSARPKALAYESLKNSFRILLAMDFDTPKWNEQQKRMIAPGAEACAWWSKHFPETWRRWPVSAGKDPGEAFRNGIDLRSWVLAGMPPAYSIQPPVIAQPQIDVVLPPKPEPAVLVKKMLDRKDRPYTITDSKTVYRDLLAGGEVVFSVKEIATSIKAVHDAGEYGGHLADLIMETKQVFKGSFLASIEE